MALATDTTYWPEWAREALEERIAIMEADDVPDAARKAADRVRAEERRGPSGRAEEAT